MKKYKNIDDLFREGARGFTVEPTTGLFNSIEANYLKQRKRKRRAIYFWSLAAFFLLVAGVSTWFILEDGVLEHSVNKKHIVEKVIDETSPKKTNKYHNETTEDQQVGPTKNNDDVDNELLNDEFNFDGEITTTFWTEEEDKSNVQHEVFIGENKSNNFIPPKSSLENLQPRSIYEIVQIEEKPIDPKTVKGMEKYLEKRSNVHFYTGIGATAGMVYYPDTPDQFTWSADLSVGLKFHDFYIESGVGYQDMQERGIYQIDFKSQDSIGYYNEVVSFEIDPQNPDEINYKTQQTTVFDSVDHYTHSTPLFKYSYLNIPLKVGYRFFQKDRFSVSAEVGFIFSKLTSKLIPEVTLNNPDYELIAITNQTPDRVEMNFQWQLSLRLNYRFAKSLSISAQPVFTKYINSIYDSKSDYSNVKPYTMGVRFGVCFGF